MASTAFFDSLPYIDAEPTPSERTAAESLISAELSLLPPPSSPTSRLPPSYTPSFTPTMAALLSFYPATDDANPLHSAIDLTRYDDPAGASDATLLSSPESLASLCAAHAHLATRHAHLSLLSRYGKPTWLLANAHAEAHLAALDAAAAQARTAVDQVAAARRARQETVLDEVKALEGRWRLGIERMVGVQVAVEEQRERTRELMRAGAARE